MYWSAVTIFKNKPEHTVDATMPTLRFIKRRNTDVRLSSIPLAVMEPPKHMAQMISQIVFIMPAIPRVATKLFNASLPVSIWVLP